MIASCIDSLKNKTIVIKIGSSISNESFYEDITTLQKLNFRIVLVTPSNVEPNEIANGICAAGGNAFADKDSKILNCVPIGFGNVGRVESVDTASLNVLLDLGSVVILSPVGFSKNDYAAYDCSDDVVTSKVAGDLKASRVLFLNEGGLFDSDMKLLKKLSVQNVNEMIRNGTILGDMILKVSFATEAIHSGAEACIITDGRLQHIVLNELVGRGSEGKGSMSSELGTIIVRND